MKKHQSSRRKALMAGLVACCAGAALAVWTGALRAKDNPKLAGSWNFNKDQSDDTEMKIQDAQQNTRGRGRNAGGIDPNGPGYPGGNDPNYPGGGPGYPGGGGVGYPGGGGIGYPRGGIGGVPIGGGMPGQGRRGMPGGGGNWGEPDFHDVGHVPGMLKIDQTDERVTILDDQGNTETLYLDGKKHKETDASGESFSVKTHWEGDRLVAESKLSHGGNLTETFKPTDDGKQLLVTLELRDPHLNTPLEIRRYYDAAGSVNGAKAKPAGNQ
jgi:hypothetical protein